MRHVITALAFALAPFSVSAEQIGSITATVDGTEMTWYVTAEGGESQSFAMKTIGIPAYQFSIWGNPEADSLASLKGALVFSFAAVAGAQGAMASELQFLEDGYSGFWTADEDAVTLDLTSFDVLDDAVSVSGHFAATAAFTDDPQTLQTDPARTKTFSGDFEATLPLR